MFIHFAFCQALILLLSNHSYCAAFFQTCLRLWHSAAYLSLRLIIVVIFAVMTYPAESVQIGYQNHVEDIRSFLDSRHADHYTVFNLSQRNYRGAKFSNRVSVLSAEDEARMMIFVALII